MSELIMGIDPGESTGWSLWALEPDLPIQRLEYGLIHGGLKGFVSFMEIRLGRLHPTTIACEKFNENDGRVALGSLVPLPIEGAIYAMASALGIELVMQPTSMKDLCRDSVLKEFGLYITNAEARENPHIKWKDARDVNDSQMHVLAFAKSINHEASVEAFWPDV